MNKTDLIKTFAEKMDVTQVKAKDIYEILVGIVEEELKSSDSDSKFTLPGLVTYIKTPREATTKRNPRTGDPVDIEAHTHLRCSPSKSLKESVR